MIALTGWQRADPLASLLIAVLILPRAFSLLHDAAVVLLEIAPRGLDLDEVRGAWRRCPGWSRCTTCTPGRSPAGSPRSRPTSPSTTRPSPSRASGPVLDRLCAVSAGDFGIHHATFQVEPPTHREHEDLGEAH